MSTPNEQPPNEAQQAPAQDLDLEQLQAALAAAEAQSVEHKDLYLRALAEVDNVRKRAARDVEQAHKFAVERFAQELLAVKDSLELGLASEATAEVLREGSEATLKLLARAFEKSGLVELDPLGQPFDPNLHEAMVAQPSAEAEPDSVLQVIQKGYQLNGRVLRPARVIVARAP